ncbi:MAG: sigma-70 family RNA polymerase sigma factor [Candidatus Omnitrophota bacterium]
MIKLKIDLTFQHIFATLFPMCPQYRQDDASLVEACINKDASAWAILIKKYYGLVALSITNRLKRHGLNPLGEDTDEIRQNVLTAIWQDGKLEQVRNRKSIACWLAIVAGNAATTHVRKKLADKSPKIVPLLDDLETEEVVISPERPDKKEFADSLEAVIGSLPPKEQLVIKLNLLDGMEYRQIAEMLNMPKGTVSSYIKRAKARLRKRLKRFLQ